MRIVTVRRISQIFFLLVFLWFCIVATLGANWWQLRGWPINWLLDLGPLTMLATVLATWTLYATLAWGLLALVLTLLVGRFFCGFVCPLGTINQFTGWLGRRGRDAAARMEANRHRKLQAFKYYLLVALLGLALMGTVQTGIFDPLPLLHRSVNLALAPLADNRLGALSDAPRHYNSTWLLGVVFLAVVGLNLALPRFFCRFLCPLGALFGLLSRFSPWRIGKINDRCGDCRICEEYCEGACRPSGAILGSECLMCMNCLDLCPAGRITFATKPSAAGEAGLPDLSRRGLVLAGGGLLLGSMWGVGALAGANRDPHLIRPPGALDEDRFLARCLRCGQCMRVCPVNIIQPTLWEAGVQGLWTPMINYRIGRSGCLINCIACGQVCPTAAIRPLSLDEKHGVGQFAPQGPVCMGLAFVDRSRCLPWALDRPCLVCQEVCPVSPKAIFTHTVYQPIRGGEGLEAKIDGDKVILAAPLAGKVNLISGDYFLRGTASLQPEPRRITWVVDNRLTLEPPLTAEELAAAKGRVDILVRLLRPYVDAARCIGCGMCENACPVSGQRAVRVYSENETRARTGRMLL